IDECENKNNTCSNLATCKNTVGSYECDCKPGTTDLNPTNPGRECQDPTKCFLKPDICSQPTDKCLDSQRNICSSKQAFACRISFKNWNFTTDLYNSESERFKNISDRITKATGLMFYVTDNLDKFKYLQVTEGMTSRLKTESFNIIIVGFRPGSVRAYFAFLLRGQQFIDANNFTDDLNVVAKSTLDNQTEVVVQEIQVDDIDECENKSNTCSNLATCKNIIGSYECDCKPGTTDLNPTNPGRECQDIDECANKENNTCSNLATCNNTIGSYTCQCFPGTKDL
ncbi:hypothetical protein lerEdw1_016757, partial [Lerista edwardsae]